MGLNWPRVADQTWDMFDSQVDRLRAYQSLSIFRTYNLLYIIFIITLFV